MPPEDELSDEVPLSDENEAATSSSDSGDQYLADGSDTDLPIAGEAPDEDPYDYQAEDVPAEDLSSELAEDAGESASYGFDAASETARFDRSEVEPGLLADSVNSPDESDKYRLLSESGDDIGASFVEEATTATGQADELAYEAAATEGGAESSDDSALSSHHPDLDAPFTVEDEAPAPDAAAAQGFTVEDDAPAPAPTKPAPPSKPARPPEPRREEVRPGQVRKSAIDEMFARAAELKRQRGS